MKISRLDIHIKRGDKHIFIPPENIKYINMSNFTESIQAVSSVSVEHFTFCELFVLELSGMEDDKMKEILQELDNKKDILDVRVNFSTRGRLMNSVFFRISWEPEAIMSETEENPFQKSMISSLGNYYLVINPVNTLEDFFSLEQIEQKEWVEAAYKQISLGEIV